MALVGTPNHRGTSLVLNGADGTNDNDIVGELDDVSRFNEFAIQVLGTGAVDVEASLDQDVGFAGPVALEAKSSTTPGTRVLVTTGDDIFYFEGNFKALRIRQAGATAATDVRLMCGQKGRTR